MGPRRAEPGLCPSTAEGAAVPQTERGRPGGLGAGGRRRPGPRSPPRRGPQVAAVQALASDVPARLNSTGAACDSVYPLVPPLPHTRWERI